ncbi:hypothetical protein Cylst_1603 [Cylindrospermum stagnale PCC 7417]|uniref:Uncharacterized protein n=1 Tax=Cylindrospermum stagnale PCC 7417 TaxID=56107 RepID=K9WVQ8_9NOST|nr:hypothetical protein [Cylindrospermum stagnale]AFZ23881.1 hypothetical protein Cylst_1603 [Cylindrospermum stagnale PCC 7417]
MMSLNTNLYLLLENLVFFALATSLIVVLGWAWRDAKPFSLPEPLPGWFKIWIGSVQALGMLLPLLVMLLWGLWWGYTPVLAVLGWYLVMLGLQILSEILALRQYHSVVWVMVPYVYLPYRFWQLYEGWTLLGSETNLLWVRNLLILELVVWIVNYALDVSQLPRLLRWEVKSNADSSIT